MYEGGFRYDVRHGEGKQTFSAGNVYEGSWKKGLRAGKGKLIFPDGGMYVGHFRSNTLHGQGKQTFPAGDVYEGYYRDGLIHGRGKYTFANGDVYKGNFKDSKWAGEGEMTFASNGLTYTGTFKDGYPIDQVAFDECKNATDCEGELQRQNNSAIGLGRITDKERGLQRQQNKADGCGEITDAEVGRQQRQNDAAGFGKVTDAERDRQRQQNATAGFGAIANAELGRGRRLMGKGGVTKDFARQAKLDAVDYFVPAAACQHCQLCKKGLSVKTMRRQHHCRGCGRVVCNACSKHRCEYIASAGHARQCDSCAQGKPTLAELHHAYLELMPLLESLEIFPAAEHATLLVAAGFNSVEVLEPLSVQALQQAGLPEAFAKKIRAFADNAQHKKQLTHRENQRLHREMQQTRLEITLLLAHVGIEPPEPFVESCIAKGAKSFTDVLALEDELEAMGFPPLHRKALAREKAAPSFQSPLTASGPLSQREGCSYSWQNGPDCEQKMLARREAMEAIPLGMSTASDSKKLMTEWALLTAQLEPSMPVSSGEASINAPNALTASLADTADESGYMSVLAVDERENSSVPLRMTPDHKQSAQQNETWSDPFSGSLERTAASGELQPPTAVGDPLPASEPAVLLQPDFAGHRWDLDAFAANPDFSPAGKLGDGHFAQVFRGTFAFRPGAAPQDVAFKLINNSHAVSSGGVWLGIADAVVRAAIQREVEVLARIGSHPNLVQGFGVVRLKRGVAIMMELMPEGPLAATLAKAATPLSWPLRSRWALEIATGMAALHALRPEPIVHRDLKAGNVLLYSGGQHVKVADFGLAKMAAASAGNSYGVGTLAWSAPETFSGAFNQATDIFGFALTAYELVTRRLPWMGGRDMSVQEIDEAVKARFKPQSRATQRKLGKGQSLETLRAEWLEDNPIAERRPSLAPDLVPADCPGLLLALVKRCWADEPSDRPTFDKVVAELTEGAISAPQSPWPSHPDRRHWESALRLGGDGQKLFPLSSARVDHVEELDEVRARFMATLPHRTVDRVDRVENGHQHEAFALNRRTMEADLGDAFTEHAMVRLLFHGTQREAIKQIVNASDGFKPLLSGTSVGAIWGDGTYFARDAQYSDSGYACTLPSGQKQLLLVRVLVGRYCRGQRGMKLYPLLPGEQYKRYNTLVDNEKDPSIFVVDKGSMAYPAYLITYH